MTVDELRTEVKADFEKVFSKLEGLAAGQATTAALLGAHDERRGAEIGALFGTERELMQRVGTIETNYTQRSDFSAHCREAEETHAELRTAIGRLDVSVGKLTALASLVAALVSGAVQLLAKLWS